MTTFNAHPIARALVALTGAFVFAAGAHAAGDKATYDQHKATAKATYETAHKQCDSLSGNAKDICQAEAKAARKKTEATAEADYDVAKERCDDKAGNDKDVCVKEAKAARDKVKADAKAQRETKQARNEAAEDKNKVAYKAEAEKCDALSGDAKTACTNQAKAKYKQ